MLVHKSEWVILFLCIAMLLCSVESEAMELIPWDAIMEGERGQGQIPLIFVHGFHPDPELMPGAFLPYFIWSTWEVMASSITEDPYLNEQYELYAFAYWPLLHPLDDIAQGFKDEVDRVLGPDSSFIILAHSMGGVMAREYIERLGGYERVKSLFTIGTPHQGVPLYTIGQGFRSRFEAIDYLEGTPQCMERVGLMDWDKGCYLVELNEEAEHNHLIYSIFGYQGDTKDVSFLSVLGQAYYDLITFLEPPSDGIVLNYSSYLPGAYNFPPLKGIHHHALTSSPRVIEIVHGGLKDSIDQKGYTVEGQVLNEQGQGIPDILVEAGDAFSITDEEGFFVFQEAKPFGTSIQPRPGLAKVSFPFMDAVDGRDEYYIFEILPAQEVRGEVGEYLTGQVVTDTEILLSNELYYQHFYRGYVDGEGSFYFPAVAPGLYRAAVVREQEAIPVFAHLLVEGEPLEVSIKVLPELATLFELLNPIKIMNGGEDKEYE